MALTEEVFGPESTMKHGRRLSTLVLVGLPLCILLFAACGGEPGSPRQNVLLITLDTQRADFIGAYGEGKAQTPHIDGFAARGTLYANAFSPIPITAPAHAALFYSLPPHRLKIYNNGQIFNPDASWTSLSEVFRRRGARTAAFVSLGVLKARFNLDAGFEEYWDETHTQRWYRTAREVNERVLPWLEQNRDSRFFVWVHYSDPHDPYAPPDMVPDLRIRCRGEVLHAICVQKREDLKLTLGLEPGENRIVFESLQPFPVARAEYRVSLNDIEFHDREGLDITIEEGALLERETGQILAFRERAVITVRNPGPSRELILTAQGNLNLFPSEMALGYRREVEYLDSEIGRLKEKLISLGLLENTLVILVGDHGEGLGEHLGENREVYFGHIHYLRNFYLKVPLIVCDPGSDSGPVRVHSPVSIMDIAPTLMAKMGWKPPSFYSGQTLPEQTQKQTRFLFQETYRPEAFEDRFGALQDPWHLIFTPATRQIQLFHTGKDRPETQDVYSSFHEDPAVQKLAREVVRRAEEIGRTKDDVELDRESREMLRSLGYIK